MGEKAKRPDRELRPRGLIKVWGLSALADCAVATNGPTRAVGGENSDLGRSASGQVPSVIRVGDSYSVLSTGRQAGCGRCTTWD